MIIYLLLFIIFNTEDVCLYKVPKFDYDFYKDDEFTWCGCEEIENDDMG